MWALSRPSSVKSMLLTRTKKVAVSMMGMGASTIMYDGSPLVTHSVLWEIVNKFGSVSPPADVTIGTY